MTTKFSSNSFISLVSYKNLNHSALRAMFVVLVAVLGVGNAWGVSSSPKFKIEKTTDSPTGGGMVYAYRGGGDGRAPYDKIELSIPASSWKNPDTEQTLINDITVQQSDNATASSHPDGYEVMDRTSNDATNSVYRLHMYYYAKPNTGYEFVGWYSDAAGTTQITGSDKHYPLPGVSGSSNDPNKYYYTSTVSKPADKSSKSYTPQTWNNGEKGKTPSPSGAWNDGEFYYLRDAFRISNATKNNDSKVYVKFRVKPRVFDLGGTGFEDVTYTATGYAGSVGKTSVSTSALSSNISLSLTYDPEKYTFNGWYWAEGSFSGGANFSTEASTTYTMVAARGLTEATRVHIWPDIKRKINPVAEVTYNEETTPYETWEEAISAAKATGVSGAIITLFQDVEEITTSQEIDRDMTLDLNGHTFSGTANYLFNVTGSGTDFTIKNDNVVEGVISFSIADVQYSYAIGVQSGAKLILESGKIYSENTKSDGSARGVEIKAGGTLLMAGGNVEAQSLQSAYAVINRGTSAISGGTLYAHTTSAATAVAYLNNGTTTTITGGTFRAYAKTTTAYGIQQNVNNTMTITDAVIRSEAVTSTAYALYRSNGVIVINGGKYNAVAPATVAATNVTNNAQVTLQGGIYRTNTNIASCAASGYGCYELNRGETWNEGYRYEVLPTSAARNFRVVADGVSSYFTNFADLNTYINESSSPVIQIFLIVPSYTIPAGNYTLPSVATLCVPYDFDCTMYGADVPQLTSTRVSPSVYRTLTLASGATLNVNGSIEVGGYQNIAGQFNSPCGAFDSKYGEIVMSSGARMSINSGANVYARGVISGQGEIDVKNGANIYESFIITDFKGGSITLTMYTANIFPLSQYYIQNIQAPMNIEYGATVNTSTGLTAGGSSYSSSIKLVGISGAMFSMTSGAIVRKEYDPSKDRQVYSINGNATLNDISLKVASYSVNSSDYVLPLTNNMTINVQSGTTTINCSSLELTADAEINILEDANLVIASGKKLAVIDYEQWDNYPGGQYIYPLGNAYAPHRTFSRTKDNMQDARIYVKGTLTVAGGLYTSSSGASIYSDNIGTSQGRIVLQSAAPGSAWTIKHKTGTSNDALKDANVSVTAAKLHNEDGTYTATAGAAANTTYVYCGGTWVKGGCITYTVTWKSEDGNTTLETDTDLTSGATTAFNSTTPSKDATAQYTYTFDGWTTEANGGGTFYANGSTPNVSGDATYYAHFSQTPRSYTLSWVTDGDVLTGSYTSGTVAYATTITAPDTPTKTGYTFAGWHNGSSVVTPSTMPAENTTYTATWTCVEPSSLSVASTGNKWDFCAGESMTLTVIGSDIAADATYQWKISKDGGSTYTNASGTNNAATYTVASMAAANGGKYTCTVTNGSCSATSAGVDVKVWYLHINNGAAGAWQDIAFINTGTGTGTANVTLESDHAYGFKLWNELGESIGWYGLDSKTISGTESNITLNSSGANVSINSGLGGTYVFTIDYTSATSPKISVTYPTANQPSGQKIYFDKSGIDGWGSNVYYRIGHTTYNSNQTLSLVLGTDQFYEMTTNGFDGFEAWHIANNVSWADDNSIYKVDGSGYAITKATNFQKYVVGSDGVTIVPTTENNTENGCTYWNVSTSDGMLTHTATISTSANGTITIFYTDVNGASQSKTSTTAGLAHRCILTITATPNPGYSLSTLTVNGAPFTSGNTYILAADATIAATWANVVIGSPLDIVDWTETELTLNANGWAASGWPYTINGTTYYKDQKSATDAGSSNYRAADRTLTIPYGGEAGADLWITLESGGSIINKNSYSIPFINTTSGTNASSIVYVNSGTLTISSNTSLAALYVRPESRVNITSGTLTVGKLVMRTLPWRAAAINGDFEAAEVWYTRIAPNKRTITGPYAPITYESSSYYQFALPRNCTVKLKDVQVSHGANTPYGNTWILKRYNEETRAANGTGEANWVVLDEEEYIQGGVGYEMSSNSNYYREFYFPLGAVSSASIGTTTAVNFHSGAAGTQHAGWNWVASPLMGVFDNSDADPETGMKIGWLLTDGSYDQGIPDYIYPAIPFAYQTSSGQSTISFAGSYIVASVPQRRVAAEEESVLLQWFHLDVKDVTGVGDHTSILTHPMRYEEAYKPGIDVAKQSFAASHALIYSSHAYGEMAFAGVADSLFEQGVALTVYSPKAQELTISMRENEWLHRMAFVWLIDQATGAQIDLLESDYSFSAEAGTTAGRFILMGAFFAPQITTDNGTVQSDDEDIKAKKFIYNDKMYIQINGVIYDATGRLVK